jgi:hypothetical protein
MSLLDHADRRREPRINQRLTFRFKQNNTEIIAETVNLTSNGVYCQLEIYIPKMTVLNLSLLLPQIENSQDNLIRDGFEYDELEIEGVIVRIDEKNIHGQNFYYTAIYFSDIEDSSRKKIRYYIETVNK